ncbi:hotdog fold thioesterase [Mesorhizobium sp. CO1-1-8]|uniref:hotdog fold thioesterase n=1 Tax=Mesorhizobium sp. CO1-1-8 TaxID=2876631 RepID=UPI001CD04DB3|nr:hotdog fold thioesterase [Mesorhizobium sp. CO1-1-8]MBZ9772387.1 hotdog fold thioesterase [Mesorhizobium sp. CO1-1-8]
MLQTIFSGFNAHIGLVLISAEKDQVVAHLNADERHLTSDERVHGGLMMALADAVAAHGTMLNLPENTTTTTIESKTNFLRGGKIGRLVAEAIPVHVGRTTMVWQTTIKDDRGSTLAIVTQTQMVLPRRGQEPARDANSEMAMTPAEPGADKGSEQGGSRRVGAERRRAQILEAAFRVISKKGFANSAMREIAQEAGMPVPTMYQYLRSKDDILVSIFDDYLGQVENSVQLSALGAATASARLAAALAANVAEFDRFQAQVRLMTRETRSLQPQTREKVKKHMFAYIDLFRSMIAQGVESKEFRVVDPFLYANFFAMLCEVWPLRQWSVGRYGVEGVQAGIVDLVLHGIKHREGAPA